MTPPVFIASNSANIADSCRRLVGMSNVSCPSTTSVTLKPSRSVLVGWLQELEKLSRVSCYRHLGKTEHSRGHKLRVSVLQKSADIIKAFTWLDAVFIVLSGEGIRRLVYLIFITYSATNENTTFRINLPLSIRLITPSVLFWVLSSFTWT
jgi:hypothetical protein